MDIEDRHWPRRKIGAKDAAIFELTGMTPVKHAQVVLGLLERGDVEAEYPVLVHRLRRLRDERARARGTAYPVGP